MLAAGCDRRWSMGDALHALGSAVGWPAPLPRLPVVLSADEVAAVLAHRWRASINCSQGCWMARR